MLNLLGVGGSCVVIKKNDKVSKIIPNVDKYLSFLKNSLTIKEKIRNNIGQKMEDYFVFPNKFDYLMRNKNLDNFIFKNNKNIGEIDYEDYLVVNLPYYEESLDCFDYFVKYRKALNKDELINVLIDFWNSLEILHENEVIHNDIKLENVLMSKDDNWRARILDFDFSFDINNSFNNNFVGTFSLINETTGTYQKTLKIIGVFTRFFRCFKREYDYYSLSIRLLKIQERLEKLFDEDRENFYRYNDIFNGIVMSLFMIKMNEKNLNKNVKIDEKFVELFLEMVNINENFKFMENFEIKNYLKKMII